MPFNRGIKWVRASTFFAYLDTPWRFKTSKKLRKYCGLGLVEFASGSDNDGNPRRGKLRMHRQVNRKLKAAVLGAAIDAIRADDNEVSEHYKRMVRNGVSEANARHTVGRKLLTTMHGMWKNPEHYVEVLVN